MYFARGAEGPEGSRGCGGAGSWSSLVLRFRRHAHRLTIRMRDPGVVFPPIDKAPPIGGDSVDFPGRMEGFLSWAYRRGAGRERVEEAFDEGHGRGAPRT